MAAFGAIGATREGIVEAPREDHAALLVENAVHLALSSEKRLSGERGLLTGVRGETVWKLRISPKWAFLRHSRGTKEAAIGHFLPSKMRAREGLGLFSKQFRRGNSANFALTELKEGSREVGYSIDKVVWHHANLGNRTKTHERCVEDGNLEIRA